MRTMTNDKRAARAHRAMREYDDPEASVRDLLADLMHYAAAHSMDFDNELRQARQHFDYEVAAEAAGHPK